MTTSSTPHPPPATAPVTRGAPNVRSAAAEALARELAAVVQGEVRFTPGDRALYATDGSNYRQLPIGVVVPRHRDDVIATVEVCRRHAAPVLARGGGTSLAGQCCNVAVVLDFSKYMNDILELNAASGYAWVEPGVVLDQLRERAERFDLTFGPDPSTHNHCTLGGMIGNNSCGVHSVMAGSTADNVQELDILTYRGDRLSAGPMSADDLRSAANSGGARGEIYRRLSTFLTRHAEAIRTGFPDIPRRVSGYNLPALLPENGTHLARALVGSEGTLVTVLRAKVRLVPSPPSRVLVVLGYPSVFEAADHIEVVLAGRPIGLEGLDDVLVDDMKRKGLHPERTRLLPEGRGWLLVEFGGQTREEAEAAAHALMSELRRQTDPPAMKLFDDAQEEAIVWKVRESGLGATARVPGQSDTWEGWEDSAVDPRRLGSYLRNLRRLFDEYGYRAALYGHFGQGCVHTRIPFDLRSADGIARFRSFVERAAALVSSHGGSLSGEHGDGQSRAELLPKMFAPELVRAFEEFKAVWDPDHLMNPGKVVHPYRLDENLRLGADYQPRKVQTHFRFPDDKGDFAYAAERCVGVGECRRLDGGTMCPSFMVLREEEHSTRGRAHLLFEMMRGSELHAWRDDKVRESLDLCLACKGCKGDCPVNVDMATYKAEFLSHYYDGRWRPRAAYAMGLIYWWARAASLAPALVNTVTQSPLLSRLAKRAGGIAPERSIPRFAARTFKQQFFARGRARRSGPRVILWPDTFNNHFFPHTALAAVEVLEGAGYDVSVPRESLCCGRPLYDFGMLDTAKALLQQVLRRLRREIREGVPVVGLEPSCVSVFRDEMHALLPDDADANRLRSQVFTFAEFVARDPGRLRLPPLGARATVHGHCHAKSLWGMAADARALERAGVEARILDSGCCGMAGSFGFEAGEKYAVSVAVGERKLIPAIRDTPPDALVVADGFSCREQIRQLTDRRPLHVAEVLKLALSHSSPRSWPAASTLEGEVPARLPAWKPAAFALASAAAAAAGWTTRRRHRARNGLGSTPVIAALAASAATSALLAWAARGLSKRGAAL
jgi:FAD/FMN-containing dehydrogenase/Fe-S oxidoreductase